jgi:hypothetical protein
MAEEFIFFRPNGSPIKITINEIMNKKLNKEISALTTNDGNKRNRRNARSAYCQTRSCAFGIISDFE